MKAYPPHSGHLYLIDTAIENSEHVHVICSHNDTQSIPGKLRVNTLVEIYKNNLNVTIYSVDDTGLPQHDSECDTLDEFYSYWVPLVYSNVKELDVVFTSEDYGDDFAKYLGIEHILVDKERSKFPISGTEVRTDPFKYWDFIPKEIRPFFTKRVAIMGPESVGKSTMTKKLATTFNTDFVLEYGRLVYESNGNKVGIDDFIPISKGRQEIEDWLLKGPVVNKLLFCDTEDITTHLFSKMYCPDEYHKVDEWFLEKLKTKPKYDLYILLKPDCRSIQDGTRIFLDERWEHYEEIKKELIKYECNYIEVDGREWEDRYNKCVELVRCNFNI